MKTLPIAALCLLPLAPAAVTGTDSVAPLASPQDPQPEKHAADSWYWIVDLDFEPGKRKRALEIMREHFQPTALAIGQAPAKVLIGVSGDNGVTLLWHMAGGVRELEWKVSPRSLKWRKALAEHCGGEEQAKALMKEYGECIRSSNGELVREMRPQADKVAGR